MLKFPLTRRKNHAAFHDTLDPDKDRSKIFEQLFLHEFPIEFLLAAEIAQLRSFTIPSGTRLLHRTGEFEKHSVKRLDDTRAILVEMGQHGFFSDHGQMMAEHLNTIHGFYQIPNDEFLYTLSTFIFDVWLFIKKFGWRELTAVEEAALYNTYADMGEVMRIKEIPPSFEAFWEWRVAYEAEHQAYAPENQLVAEGLLRGIREMVPRVLRPFVLPLILSLEDDRFAELLGYQPPHPLIRSVVRGGMWLRQRFNRFFTLWDVLDYQALILSDFKSYPHGYNLLDLGPEKLVKQIHARQKKNATPPQHTGMASPNDNRKQA